VSNPWADPATPTEPGAPYAGPPATSPTPSSGSPYGPPVYGLPGYSSAPYGQPPYGQPPYGMPPYGGQPPAYGYPAPWLPPRPPRRPGQLITAAVLAFVQGGMVLIASLYVWFFASLADLLAQQGQQGQGGTFSPATVDALATEGTTLAIVQLVSFVLLVAGGVRALNARTRAAWRLLVAAHAVQVVLSIYWAIRLSMLLDEAGPDGGGPLVVFALFFAAGPVVALGLLLTGTVREWFAPAGQSAGAQPV
jgi:hypothetical protein